jgi:hypothetical protein
MTVNGAADGSSKESDGLSFTSPCSEDVVVGGHAALGTAGHTWYAVSAYTRISNLILGCLPAAWKALADAVPAQYTSMLLLMKRQR